MGLYSFRRRGRLFRLLDEGRGRPADEDVTTKKRDLDREAEEESGTGSSRGSSGANRARRDSWSVGCHELTESGEGKLMDVEDCFAACRPQQAQADRVTLYKDHESMNERRAGRPSLLWCPGASQWTLQRQKIQSRLRLLSSPPTLMRCFVPQAVYIYLRPKPIRWACLPVLLRLPSYNGNDSLLAQAFGNHLVKVKSDAFQ